MMRKELSKNGFMSEMQNFDIIIKFEMRKSLIQCLRIILLLQYISAYPSICFFFSLPGIQSICDASQEVRICQNV